MFTAECAQNFGFAVKITYSKGLVSQLVSWCFKPSQPQRITSGLIFYRTSLSTKVSTKNRWRNFLQNFLLNGNLCANVRGRLSSATVQLTPFRPKMHPTASPKAPDDLVSCKLTSPVHVKHSCIYGRADSFLTRQVKEILY